MSGELDEYVPLLSLLRVKGLAGKRLRRLVAEIGSPEEVLKASSPHLSAVKGIGPDTVAGIREAAAGKFDRQVRRDIEWLRKKKATAVSIWDANYPAILKETHSPPVLLYVRGQLEKDAFCVSIVGSRKASDYGRRLAGQIAEELAAAGITIVSGLAHGIDAAAHKGALRGRGRTVAVMGCGLKTVYPRHHLDLAEQVVRSGAIVTELPLEATPQRKNFIPRNRIIAGLSLGTIVVEAATQSGALATARFAQEENREVFALPGRPSDETSQGANQLIREQGAMLITGAADVLEILRERKDICQSIATSPDPTNESVISGNEREFGPKLDGDEAILYDTLTDEDQHIDDLARTLSLDIGKISSLLGLLEMRGLVERQPGAHFRRAQGTR